MNRVNYFSTNQNTGDSQVPAKDLASGHLALFIVRYVLI